MSSTKRHVRYLLAGSILFGLSRPALCQIADEDTASGNAATIVVKATRSRIPDSLRSVPGSITIVDAEQIAEQMKVTSDLGEILQKTVPGFGLSSSGSFSNFSQTLRGRKPAVFIDGVPITLPLRDGAHDLRTISPSVIGRVEVIRGSTALYGLGGAGGIINYATIEPSGEGVQLRSDVSAGLSLTHPGDSLNWSASQTVLGRSGRVSFAASAFYENTDSLFDAKGDRLPPDPQNQGGIADSVTYNLYGKLGLDFTDTQHVFVSANYFSTEQDTGYSSKLGGFGVFGSVPTPAIAVPPLGEDQKTRNLVATARYVNEDFLGSELTLMGFLADFHSVFSYSTVQFPNEADVLGGQSILDGERWGARLDISTPLDFLGGGNVLWGIDFTKDETSQPLTDGRIWVPALKQQSIAPFLQADVPVSDFLNLVGGLRWENSKLNVDTFTQIRTTLTNPATPRTIQGGELKYSKLLFNVGAVLSPFRDGPLSGFSIFAGWSQGFTVGDFGRAIRVANVPSVEVFSFDPQVVNSYEIGVRAKYDTIRGQASVFRSTSNLGGSFNAVTFDLVRQPEEIWGIELSLDGNPSDDWSWGGSVSWSDGETTSPTGIVSPLDTTRIPPLKGTFYLQYEIAEAWKLRGQFTYSGRQDRFPGNPQVFGRADVESFSLLDLSLTGKVGPGQMTLAINNALNEFYFTPDAWRFAGADSFTAGQGAVAKLSYTLQY